MAIVKGPAMSLDASGSLAGAIVFSKWKGRNYVRQLVTPANPKSGAQTGFRSSMKFLAQNWAGLTAGEQATFEDRAADMIVSPFNAYTSMNQRRWRNFLTPSQEDPAAEAAADAGAMTNTGTAGVRMASLSIAAGSPAPTWGIVIYRSLVTGFTPGISNVIAMILQDGMGPTVYVDTPLDPDTYYYRTSGFNVDGTGGALDTEESVIIT